MFHKPNRRVDVPGTDLLTWVFGNEDSLDLNRPVMSIRSRCLSAMLTAVGTAVH